MQRALNYIEEHITEELDYEKIAECSFSFSYHFQRVFSLLCGYTLGEYIRNRRLTLAGSELAQAKIKVIDAAMKYGYESPDSFAKAFQKFHGITPSAAREPGAVLRSFAPLSIKISLEGGNIMNYRIEEKEEMILTGYKQRFSGVPYGEQRVKQEEKMFISTRGKQWLLRGMAYKNEIDYCIITNIDDDGYDFYIASELDKWDRDFMYDQEITGVTFMEDMNFEHIVIPRQKYVIFETKQSRRPIKEYIDLRQRIVSEWLPNSGYQFAEGPELTCMHWRPVANIENRFIEIWLPIEKVE